MLGAPGWLLDPAQDQRQARAEAEAARGVDVGPPGQQCEELEWDGGRAMAHESLLGAEAVGVSPSRVVFYKFR